MVSNCNNCCIAMIQLHKYTDAGKYRNTDDQPLFRHETFIYFLSFSFSTRGERDTIFTMLTVSTSPQSTGLARPRVKSQLFFRNHHILSPSLPGMTSFTPQSIFYYFIFYYDICDCHILCVRA